MLTEADAAAVAADEGTYIPVGVHCTVAHGLLFLLHLSNLSILLLMLVSKPPYDVGIVSGRRIVVPIAKIPHSLANEAPLLARVFMMLPALLCAISVAKGLYFASLSRA